MPLQNRMNPMGQLHGVKARGLLMGNRGQLHNAAREIVRPWKLNRWITCALEYQGIKRELMASNSYTELFFLDEPTSYAAGHRPCGDCRKDRYKAFKGRLGQNLSGSGSVCRRDRQGSAGRAHERR